MKVIIMHGTLGSPEGNWFPWLKSEIEKLGHTAIVPKFPTPEDQTIKEWIEILDKHVGVFDESVILVGHSSACLVICAKLQEITDPIAGAFLVAPFYGDIGNSEYDEYNHEFNQYHFDWSAIKTKADFHIYRGDDDPYVPAENGELLSKYLSVREIIIPRGGHLGSSRNTFEELLIDLKEIL